MRALIQRVSRAGVRSKDNGDSWAQTGPGFLVLLGVAADDDRAQADYLVRKIVNLRVFEDDDGKMNLSLKDVGGQVLVVSQFTLYGSVRRGNRPSFTAAAPPAKANELYEYVVEQLRSTGISVETGRFGANMQVDLVNDGPVTIFIDSQEV